MKKSFDVIGIRKEKNNIRVDIYCSDGNVKNCYVSNIGFKIHNDPNLDKVFLNVKEYEDKTKWVDNEIVNVGKDKNRIKECVIVASRDNIDYYMNILGIMYGQEEPEYDNTEELIRSIEDISSRLSSLSMDLNK